MTRPSEEEIQAAALEYETSEPLAGDAATEGFEAGARWPLSLKDHCDACGEEMTWPVLCEKCEAGITRPTLEWKRPEEKPEHEQLAVLRKLLGEDDHGEPLVQHSVARWHKYANLWEHQCGGTTPMRSWDAWLPLPEFDK